MLVLEILNMFCWHLLLLLLLELAQTEHCNIPKVFIIYNVLTPDNSSSIFGGNKYVWFRKSYHIVFFLFCHSSVIPQQLRKYCVVFWLYYSVVFVLYFSAAAFSIIGAAPVERSLHRHLGVWHHHHQPQPQSFVSCPLKDPGFCERVINTKTSHTNISLPPNLSSDLPIFLFLPLKILGS